jgi:hypothetical protein
MMMACRKQEVTSMQLKSPLEDFKERIGFDEAPRPAADAVVVLDWNKPAEHLGLSGWNPLRESVTVRSGEAMRMFEFGQGDGRLRVEAYAGESPERARQRLLELASMTMMRRIPFEKGPAVGDLSCQSAEMSDRGAIIWTRANTCVRVSIMNAAPSRLREWCARLDAAMAATVTRRAAAASAAPRIRDSGVSPKGPTVSDTVTVTWRIEGGKGIKSGAEVESPADESVEVLDQTDGQLLLRARMPGRIVIRITAADPQWLVPASDSLEIQIGPGR